MDAYSFNLFEQFYNCASEILEQQQLMKNLQKNSFFLVQQTIINLESSCLHSFLSADANNLEDAGKLYANSKENLEKVINQNVLTKYIPMQIRITLESALKKVGFISIIGCEGYKELKKYAK